jgi:tRNA A37 threonylcarbamoyladenosine dehydratase
MDLERTSMLIGKAATDKLKKCHVAVFGLGGVGGHTVEALVRSGIGELTLVDADCVAESNLNRQIIATARTVGMPKTEAAAARIAEIGADCKLNLRAEFVLPENIHTFDFSKYDYVVDAIDTVSAKLAMIKSCHAAGTPIISAMGAGNKTDPTRFEVSDIYKTSVCPLCKVIRTEARKRRIKSLKVVYSKEEPIKITDTQGIEIPEGKRQIPGSIAFVPSVVGLIIAGEVIKDLIK